MTDDDIGLGERTCRLARDLRAYRRPCPTGMPGTYDSKGRVLSPPSPPPCMNGCVCDRREAERAVVIALGRLAVHVIDLPRRIARTLSAGWRRPDARGFLSGIIGGRRQPESALPVAVLLPSVLRQLEAG